MNSLLSQMEKCKTIKQCIDLALTDAYEEEEIAVAWLTCMEEIIGHHKKVEVLNQQVTIKKFILRQNGLLALCSNGKTIAQVSLDSIYFPPLTRTEKLWIRAWSEFSSQYS